MDNGRAIEIEKRDKNKLIRERISLKRLFNYQSKESEDGRTESITTARLLRPWQRYDTEGKRENVHTRKGGGALGKMKKFQQLFRFSIAHWLKWPPTKLKRERKRETRPRI